MATAKQLSFIKAICDELSLDEPREDITTREASRFISKNVAKFYAKKTKDKENSLKANSGGNNYKYESSFKGVEKLIGISEEQNIENIKNALRHYYGFDIWTGERR